MPGKNTDIYIFLNAKTDQPKNIDKYFRAQKRYFQLVPEYVHTEYLLKKVGVFFCSQQQWGAFGLWFGESGLRCLRGLKILNFIVFKIWVAKGPLGIRGNIQPCLPSQG